MKTSKCDILYVDDEQDNLDVFESSFWKDYNIHLAHSAKEGLNILSKEKIHLIITDQRMPVMTGIEFLERINNEHPDPVRMVLTGYSDLDTVVEAINKGKVFHYVTKPWKRESLKKDIERGLENFRLREENEMLLQKLQISNNKLEQLNKGLEDEVNQRTIELTEKNKLLDNTLDLLKNAQVGLVKSEKLASLGMLSAAIGHEINNPIGAIKGGLDIFRLNLNYLFPIIDKVIETDFNDLDKVEELKVILGSEEFEGRKEDVITMLNDVISSTDRTTDIINSLRNFTGSKVSKFQAFDIHEGLDATLLLLRSVLRDANIETIKNYDLGIGHINCIPGQLNQVFMNLLVNAKDAIEANPSISGKIQISTSHTEDVVKIKISDNGIGISKKVISNIFEAFFSTKDHNKGTGLGLPICKDIIDEHKGTIEVSSHQGAETSFIISLPR